MAEGDEGRRAAQIRAVRDILLRRVALLPGRGWTSEQLAAEVVDAVNAAGRDERAKRHAAGYLDEIGPEAPATLPYDAEDQWRAEVRDVRTNYRFLRPQHPGDEDLRDVQQIVQVWELDPNYAVEYSHRWVGPWMHANPDGTLVDGDHSAADHLDQARAAGYAAAVANLRDDERFDEWRWQPKNHHISGFHVARQHAADYLEAVGPGQGQGGEVHRVERRPDGVIAEEHIFTRKHLNELVEGTPRRPGGAQRPQDGLGQARVQQGSSEAETGGSGAP